MDDNRDGGGTAAQDDRWQLPGYTHGRELGAGAAGRVVLAVHDATGTPVAIKYLLGDRADHANLRAEAELLGALDSPNVTRLYEYVEGPEGAAIVMEPVEGVSLRDLLQAEGATTPQAALAVLKGSLLGLADAHRTGVVHRDYKPGNVLVTTDGTSKLVDFGIALRTGTTGDIAGTPAYMAPEQWAGEPASPATDVYAATATFFECLTGAKPYAGTTLMELAVQHTEADIPDEQAPESLRPLIRAGLAKTARERPSGAADLVAKLEQIAAAAFGADWEEKGRRDLAALVLLLPWLLPHAHGPVAGTTSVATTTLPPTPPGGPAVGGAVRRFGTRAKILSAAAGLVVLGGTLAGVAAAGTSDADGHTDVAAPAATTSFGADGSASPVPSPSASPSGSPSASPSASPSSSPSASASASPTASPSGSPTKKPTSSPPTSPAPSTSAPSSPPPPVLTVYSVGVSGSPTCWNSSTSATVAGTADGAAAGRLTVTWYKSATSGGPTTRVSSETVDIAKGSTKFSHVFVSPALDYRQPYWTINVSTSPAAVRTGKAAPYYGYCPVIG